MHFIKCLLTLVFVSGYTEGFIYKCGEKITVKKGEKRSIAFWGDEGELLRTNPEPSPSKPANVVASSGIELLTQPEQVNSKISTSKKRPKIEMSLLERLGAALRPTRPIPSRGKPLPEEEFVKNADTVPKSDKNENTNLFSSQDDPSKIKQTQIDLENLPNEPVSTSSHSQGLHPVTIQKTNTRISDSPASGGPAEQPTNRKEGIPLIASSADEEILKAIEMQETLASNDPVIKVTKEKEEIASLELMRSDLPDKTDMDHTLDVSDVPADTSSLDEDIIENIDAASPSVDSVDPGIEDQKLESPSITENQDIKEQNLEKESEVAGIHSESQLDITGVSTPIEVSPPEVPVIYNDEDIQTTIDELTQQLNNEDSDKESISISLSILENLMNLMKSNPTSTSDQTSTTFEAPDKNVPGINKKDAANSEDQAGINETKQNSSSDDKSQTSGQNTENNMETIESTATNGQQTTPTDEQKKEMSVSGNEETFLGKEREQESDSNDGNQSLSPNTEQKTKASEPEQDPTVTNTHEKTTTEEHDKEVPVPGKEENAFMKENQQGPGSEDENQASGPDTKQKLEAIKPEHGATATKNQHKPVTQDNDQEMSVPVHGETANKRENDLVSPAAPAKKNEPSSSNDMEETSSTGTEKKTLVTSNSQPTANAENKETLIENTNKNIAKNDNEVFRGTQVEELTTVEISEEVVATTLEPESLVTESPEEITVKYVENNTQTTEKKNQTTSTSTEEKLAPMDDEKSQTNTGMDDKSGNTNVAEETESNSVNPLDKTPVTDNPNVLNGMALPEVVSFPLPVLPVSAVNVQGEKNSDVEQPTTRNELPEDSQTVLSEKDVVLPTNNINNLKKEDASPVDSDKKEPLVDSLQVDPLISGLEAELSVSTEHPEPSLATSTETLTNVTSDSPEPDVESDTSLPPSSKDDKDTTESPIKPLTYIDSVPQTKLETDTVSLPKENSVLSDKEGVNSPDSQKPGTRGDYVPQSDFHPELFEMRDVLQKVRLRGEPLINIQESDSKVKDMDETNLQSSPESIPGSFNLNNEDEKGEIVIPTNLIEFLKQESFPLEDSIYKINTEDILSDNGQKSPTTDVPDQMEKSPEQQKVDPLAGILELLENEEKQTVETATSTNTTSDQNVKSYEEAAATELPEAFDVKAEEVPLEMESVSFTSSDTPFERFDTMDTATKKSVVLESSQIQKETIEKSSEPSLDANLKTEEAVVDNTATEFPVEVESSTNEGEQKTQTGQEKESISKISTEDKSSIPISGGESETKTETPPEGSGTLAKKEIETEEAITEVERSETIIDDQKEKLTTSQKYEDEIMTQIRNAGQIISYVDNVEPVVIKEQGSKIIVQNPNLVSADAQYPIDQIEISELPSKKSEDISETSKPNSPIPKIETKLSQLVPELDMMLPPSDIIEIPQTVVSKESATTEAKEDFPNQDEDTQMTLENDTPGNLAPQKTSDTLSGMSSMPSLKQDVEQTKEEDPSKIQPETNEASIDISDKPFVRLEFTDETSEVDSPTSFKPVSDPQPENSETKKSQADAFKDTALEVDAEKPHPLDHEHHPVSVRIPDGLKDQEIIKLLKESINLFEELEIKNQESDSNASPSSSDYISRTEEQSNPSQKGVLPVKPSEEKLSFSESDVQTGSEQNQGIISQNSDNVENLPNPVTDDKMDSPKFENAEKEISEDGQTDTFETSYQESSLRDESDSEIVPPASTNSDTTPNSQSNPESPSTLLQSTDQSKDNRPVLQETLIADKIQEDLDNIFLPNLEANPSEFDQGSPINPSEGLPDSAFPAELRTPDESSIIDMIRDFIFSAPQAEGDQEKSVSNIPNTQELISALSRKNSHANRRYDTEDSFDFHDYDFTNPDETFGFQPYREESSPDHRLQTRKGLVDHEPAYRQEINSRRDDSPVHYAGDAPFFIKIPGSPNAVPVFLQYEPIKVNYVPAAEMNQKDSSVLAPKNSGPTKVDPQKLSKPGEDSPIIAPEELDPFFIMEAPDLASDTSDEKDIPTSSKDPMKINVHNTQEASVNVGGTLGLTNQNTATNEKDEILYPGQSYDTSYPRVDTATLSNPVFKLSPKATVPTVDMNPQYTPFALTTNPPKTTTEMTIDETTTESRQNITTKTPSSTEYSPVPFIQFEGSSDNSEKVDEIVKPEALKTDSLISKSPEIPKEEFDIVALANFLHQSQKVWSERQTPTQPSLGAWRGQNWDTIKYEPPTQGSWKDPITAWQELGVGSQRGYSAFYSPEEVPGWDPSMFPYNKIAQNQRQPRSQDVDIDALKQYILSLPLPMKQAVLSNTESTRSKRHVFLGENINCEWNIESDPGLFLLVTFNKLSAEYSVDCTGAYIEVERENNGFDARWCGNRVAMDGSRSHVIFAKSKVRISVFDNGDSTKMHPTGFEADVEAIDLFDNKDYNKLTRARSKMRRLVEV